MYLRETELFEIELLISGKKIALNNLKCLMCH